MRYALTYIFILSTLLISCSNNGYLSERQRLSKTNDSLKAKNETLNYIVNSKADKLAMIEKELSVYESGKTPVYIVKFEIKRTGLKVIENSIHTGNFEMCVNKEFYEKINVGQSLDYDLSVGTFNLYGDLGKHELTVLSKRIK